MTTVGDLPQEADDTRTEFEELRRRLFKLSEVSRRVTESLDVGSVLHEVVDGARSLTDARYGALAVFDDSGRVREFITSGITREESRLLGSLPQGLGLLGYLNENREPLRLADLAQHPQSIGFPENHPPMKTFPALGAPIRHLGEPVGNIYLTEKLGGLEFTPEDEETLALFASQAAMAILNALRFREERQARSVVEDERARLEALVRTSPVGVLVVDAETRKVVSVNQEAQRIMGLAPEPGSDLERYQRVAIYRRADGSEYKIDERPMSRALDRGETVRAEEILFDGPDGKTVTTLINATPIYSESGEIVSAVAVIQDMTPIEEMQRLRNDFLAMVSHELRTPLTAIKGSTGTVLSTSTPFDPVETRRFFRTIDQQADLMSDLVSNLLDVTRIEAGALVVSPQRTDVEELVDEAVSTFLRGGTRSYIEVDLQPDLPAIAADPQRVTQVLNNLLSNASKYSPRSSRISVTALVKESYVAISVTDEGSGVPPEQIPRLFGKFSRIDHRSDEGNVAGHGLGLAICKGIVEAHGGRIWAESDGDGRGARFTFTIPLATDVLAASAREAAPTGRPVRSVERVSILAVDDDPHVLRYMRNTLSDAGYSPMGTANPNEMVHLLELERPRLVLLDLILPGTNGFELMKRIREISDVPVIFLSASSEEEHIVHALELGADDYIVKPFSPTELVARVEASLRKSAKGTGTEEERQPYRLEDVTIDYAERNVTVSGCPVKLTATEYKLLFELSINVGRVMTHEQLLHRVWGAEYSGDEYLVRVFVGNLRRKLRDDAKHPRYIFTERGVGYQMARPSA